MSKLSQRIALETHRAIYPKLCAYCGHTRANCECSQDEIVKEEEEDDKEEKKEK